MIFHTAAHRQAVCDLVPAAHLSMPAQATITPLSVHKCMGGTRSSTSALSASLCSSRLTSWLQATPPADSSVIGHWTAVLHEHVPALQSRPQPAADCSIHRQ